MECDSTSMESLQRFQIFCKPLKIFKWEYYLHGSNVIDGWVKSKQIQKCSREFHLAGGSLLIAKLDNLEQMLFRTSSTTQQELQKLSIKHVKVLSLLNSELVVFCFFFCGAKSF